MAASVLAHHYYGDEEGPPWRVVGHDLTLMKNDNFQVGFDGFSNIDKNSCIVRKQ